MRNLRRLSALLTLALLAAADSSAQTLRRPVATASLDAALQHAHAGDRPRVIVQYRPGAEARVTKRLRAGGALLRGRHPRIGALSVQLPAAILQSLRTDPDVLAISLDARLGATQSSAAIVDAVAASTSSSYDAQGLRRTLGLTDGDTGSGVGVAIIDSGIAPVADVAPRVVAFYDFTDGSGGSAAPLSDGYGHGTHIAGLVAGSGLQSGGQYVGMAPNVRLIGLKVLDATGQGYSSDVVSAIEFAITHKADFGIDVINLSLGHAILEPGATDPLVQAVERAVDAGIVVVVAAGNRGMDPVTGAIGYAGITSPGNAPSALTVGSLRTHATVDRGDDEVSPFSSRGPTWYDGLVKPDVLAPGQALIAIGDPDSTLAQNPLLRADLAPYLKLSGTSMAAGIATGVVADVIAAHRAAPAGTPDLTPNAIKAILQYTALDVAGASISGAPKELAEGTGALNAAGAIAVAQAIDTTAGVDTAWVSYAPVRETTIGDVTYAWTAHIVWGAQIIWGDTILWNETAWAEHVIWGDATDGHVTWGDTFLPDPYSLTFDSLGTWDTNVVGGTVQTLDDGHVIWGDGDDGHIIWGDSFN